MAESQGEVDTWLDATKANIESGRGWWKKVPKGWELFGEHYRIARDMTPSQYKYLLSLPLTLYVPSAHTFVAHAGLLASNPVYKPHHPRQPLGHLPKLTTYKGYGKEGKRNAMRKAQEEALLKDIPQNKDPWVVLNMRGVEDDHTVTRFVKYSFSCFFSFFLYADGDDI